MVHSKEEKETEGIKITKEIAVEGLNLDCNTVGNGNNGTACNVNYLRCLKNYTFPPQSLRFSINLGL